MGSVSADLIADLAQYDTPTICNVIELFDVRPRTEGYMRHDIRQSYATDKPMVGLATTASFRSSSAGLEGQDVYSQMERQVQQFAEWSENGKLPLVVVFQDLDDPTVSATFGEVMCTTYKNFGCVGLVTSGTGRDIEQVQALGDFAVFSKGNCCSHGYCHITSINEPVHVGGLTVRPGDLIHGDANGVTNIPKEIAFYVAALAPKFMEAEDATLSWLKKGSKDMHAWNQSRDRMNERMAQLKELALKLKNKDS